MTPFFVRFVGILGLALLQFSFVTMAEYHVQSPNILLALVLAYTLVMGFARAMKWLILAGVLMDLMGFYPIGISVIVFIILGYSSSFLSRRFFVEHRFFGVFSVVGFVFFATLLHMVMLYAMEGWHAFQIVMGSIGIWKTIGEFFWVVGVNTVLFFVLYTLVTRIERYLSFYETQIKPKNYA